MSPRHWLYLAASGAGAVALLAWAFAPRPVLVEQARVTVGRFEEFIEDDGKTRLRDIYLVSAPLAGRVARITLREGDAVDAGAMVARIRPSFSPLLDERSLREQRARLEAAEAQVRRARARVDGAALALQRARTDLQRSEQLARQGFLAPSRLETDRVNALSAQKEREAASAEQDIANHEASQARAALMTVRQPGHDAGAAFAVYSPIAGEVLKVVQTSEAVVPLGAPLLELGDRRGIDIVAELLTADAIQAVPGSPVKINRWGGPTLDGRVNHMEPEAFTKISALGVEEQRVRVLIDIVSPYSQWRGLGVGFRVNLRVITLARDKVGKVPVGALFPLPQSDTGAAAGERMALYTIDHGRARLTAVQVGGRNDEEAWIAHGLAPGTAVIVYPPPNVKDGTRVSVRSVDAPV